jgi:hypothetical protein
MIAFAQLQQSDLQPAEATACCSALVRCTNRRENDSVFIARFRFLGLPFQMGLAARSAFGGGHPTAT